MLQSPTPKYTVSLLYAAVDLRLVSNESLDEQLSDFGEREFLVMTRLRLILHDRQDDRDESLDCRGEVALKVMLSSCAWISSSRAIGDDGALNDNRFTDAISS